MQICRVLREIEFQTIAAKSWQANGKNPRIMQDFRRKWGLIQIKESKNIFLQQEKNPALRRAGVLRVFGLRTDLGA